jgi:hypothetical protein
MIVANLWRRLTRLGFPAFLIGCFLVALGLNQGVAFLWAPGLILVGLVVLVIVVRAVRDVWFPPRRRPSNDR